MLDIQRLLPFFAIPAACLLAVVASFAQDVTFAPSAKAAIKGLATTQAGAPVFAPDGCCQPGWVPTFGGEPGVNGDVHASTVFDDGSGPALYIGGGFTTAGGVPANFIAKWDGATWSALGSGMDDYVFALAVFDAGTGPALYAGGRFETAGGVAASRIAKWDGLTWSALGSGMDSEVNALSVYDDGSGPALIAGGQFAAAGGQPAVRIAQWDGMTWSALGTGMSDDVYALTVFDEGTGPALYAGGPFFIEKWDGATWSPLGGRTIGVVYSLTVFDDSSGLALYMSGDFYSAGGVPANSIAKWDGSSWSALGNGMPARVSAMAGFDDGTGPALYVGGPFFIKRWDGATWSALDNGMNGTVNVLTVHNDGGGSALYVGGDFNATGSVAANHIAMWNGSTWSALGSGMNSEIAALTVFDDGGGPGLYAGGAFATAWDVEAHGIAKWDGTAWSALDSGFTFDDGQGPAHTGWVKALAVFDDGNGPALYAGGEFTNAGAIAANGVARWDGSNWSTLGSGVTGQNNRVYALTVFDDGDGPGLYAGGIFTTAGGIMANQIAKWDGLSWSALASGIEGPRLQTFVVALGVFDDGSGPALYAGGDFTTAGGLAASGIAKWDGATWSSLGTGTNFFVSSLAVFDDGSGPALYVGGNFSMARDVTASRIAKWNGLTWSEVGTGVEGYSVGVMTPFDDGSGLALFVGGYFNAAGNVAASNIAKWDGSNWSALGRGMNSSARSLAVFDNGSGPALYAGGSFTSAFDSHDSYLAKWQGCFDTTPPTIACPSVLRVVDDWDDPPGEIVNFQVTASDPCGVDPTVVCVPPSGSFFPRGTTIVTCTATDASGNQATCTFPVIVEPKIRRRR